MRTLWLRVRAPFAAFRWMQAGVYRATSPVMPPSAAWGLLLNLAGCETRRLDSRGRVTTPIDPAAPPLCLAVGLLAPPSTATLYQQLHGYPVGASGKELAPRTKGAKYWIAPATRELLTDLDCQIGARAADERLLNSIVEGLEGHLNAARYGLPFAGDNNLLIDRIDVLEQPKPARWYEAMGPQDGPSRGSCRLTVGIDRTDSSRTTTILYAPTATSAEPPARAWTWTPRAPRGE